MSLCHSDTLLALKPSSQRTVSHYSLSTSHAVLSFLMLLPHGVVPHTQLSSAQSDRTGYFTQLHCHTHALGKHNQFTCHTLSLASVQDPLRNSASRIGTEESNLKACHPQARSAHKSLARTSNSAALGPHPQSFGSRSTSYGRITVVEVLWCLRFKLG